MKDETREILGFLCRWCLLGLAWAALAAAGWVSLSAARHYEGQSRIVMPDMVLAAGRGAHLTGVVIPERVAAWDGFLLNRLPGGATVCNTGEHGHFLASAAGGGAGDHEIRVIGVPYGLLSFQSARALLRVVPPGREAFFVEASLAEWAADHAPASWARCQTAMRQRGTPAVFCAGPVAEYDALRERLRKGGIAAPVVFAEERPGNPLQTLDRARRLLLTRQGGSSCVAVTDRAETAYRLADAGFLVHLVGADGGGATSRPRAKVQVHPDLDSLAEFLAKATPHGPP